MMDICGVIDECPDGASTGVMECWSEFLDDTSPVETGEGVNDRNDDKN